MLAPPLSEGGRAGGAHAGTGRVPPTLVRWFCNVILSPRDVPPARCHLPAQAVPSEPSQGVTVPRDVKAQATFPRMLSRVRMALAVIASHTGQLQEISQTWALFNLIKASLHHRMCEASRKGICVFRQKFVSYFS